jgi:hypothetical protein
MASDEASPVKGSPTFIEASLRQEVSEPIGLGRSSHDERSLWEEQGLDCPSLPLTRDLSAGFASKGASPPAQISYVEGLPFAW